MTEIPYMVNKARLIEKMADLVRDKKIDGITGTYAMNPNREGMRINIELRRDANANVVLNQLYEAHTAAWIAFGVIMLALVDQRAEGSEPEGSAARTTSGTPEGCCNEKNEIRPEQGGGARSHPAGTADCSGQHR